MDGSWSGSPGGSRRTENGGSWEGGKSGRTRVKPDRADRWKLTVEESALRAPTGVLASQHVGGRRSLAGLIERGRLALPAVNPLEHALFDASPESRFFPFDGLDCWLGDALLLAGVHDRGLARCDVSWRGWELHEFFAWKLHVGAHKSCESRGAVVGRGLGRWGGLVRAVAEVSVIAAEWLNDDRPGRLRLILGYGDNRRGWRLGRCLLRDVLHGLLRVASEGEECEREEERFHGNLSWLVCFAKSCRCAGSGLRVFGFVIRTCCSGGQRLLFFFGGVSSQDDGWKGGRWLMA